MAEAERSKLNQDKKARLDLEYTMVKIISLLMRHTPHELTMSKISRFVNVPRSTLYYYFGKDVPSLISEAARFAMKQFVQADTLEDFKSFATWKDYQYHRLSATVALVQRFPWATRLYFRYRDDPGVMGKTIREVEEEWVKGQRKALKYYSASINHETRYEKIAGSVKLGFLWSIAILAEEKGKNKTLFEPKEFEYLVGKVADLCSEFLESKK